MDLTPYEDLGLLTADGLDDAIIGVGQQFNRWFIVYDKAKVIQILIERDGMDEDDAEEFFEVNIVGAWVGDTTPAFVTLADRGTNPSQCGSAVEQAENDS